ncbi:hypothetical protein RKD52_001600 [Metabacillus sp. SLBN-84]
MKYLTIFRTYLKMKVSEMYVISKWKTDRP